MAVRIVAKARQLPQWTMDKAFPYSAERPPPSPISCDNNDGGDDNTGTNTTKSSGVPCGPEQEVILVPYGSTRLRVGLLPWIEAKGR